MGFSIPRPQASKIQTQADIAFCIDATASMNPCLNGVRDGLIQFVDGLQSAADVDFRLRLLAYRDIHPNGCNTPWEDHPFTNSPAEFKKQISRVNATGGGDEPESTLDALYRVIRSPWRESKTHKTIVLLTDADTHPLMHKSTYSRSDNDVYRVIQEFQTLHHAMLFIVAPQYDAYQKLEKSAVEADRKVVAHWIPRDDLRYQGLANINWGPLLMMLGQFVSATSIVVSQEA